ncbi:MAG: molecular chaperone HtpG [Candidatus Hodarchaeales archaeon]|jgi:molecular chaperone HtpG
MSEENHKDNNTSESFQFQAEIQKVLDILINRLYKNRDIFLRELISNSADALHRVRIALLEDSENALEPDTELGIRVSFDEEEMTIKISDNGIGMTRDEIITNLGTIAQSGTMEFLKQANESDVANLIGQFGVGFYSSFIVSAEVVVRSRSYKTDSIGVEWRSTGTGIFSVSPSDKESRGTDVILHLKEDAKEFANKYRLETIIKMYSDFVGFPIRVGEEESAVNRQVPIWHQTKEEVTEEEYDEFYRQVSMDFSKPFHRIELSVDAPIQFRALLFLPSQRNRMMFSQQQDYGLRLYSKKILVQEKAKDLLPEYLRFVFGVVDSEDLPLNVSREVIQVDRTIRRISKVLTGKIIDELDKIADEDEAKYLDWWRQFGVFLREGITQDEKRRKKLLHALRIRTSKSEDEFISLVKYVGQMPEDQEEIFYLLGDNYQSLKNSPHLEYYKKQNQEVILFADPIDTFVLMHVTEYKDKKFKPIDQAEPEPPKEDEKEEGKEEEEEELGKDPFLSHLKELLEDRVIDIQYTDSLTDSPCRLINPSGTTSFSRVLKFMEEDYIPQKKIMEINKNHEIITHLITVYEKAPDSPLLQMCILQLLENQELAEGILQNSSEMITRVNEFIKLALKTKI